MNLVNKSSNFFLQLFVYNKNTLNKNINYHFFNFNAITEVFNHLSRIKFTNISIFRSIV